MGFLSSLVGAGDLLGGVGRALFGGGNKAVKRVGQGLDEARTAITDQYGNATSRLDQYATLGADSTGFLRQLLGMDGGTAGGEALSRFRDSTGYRDTMNAALGGVTSNAAARGLLGSSGTGKVFQTTAANVAQGSFGDFLNRLLQQQQIGYGASKAQSALDAGLGDALAGNSIEKGEVMSKKKSFLGSIFGG